VNHQIPATTSATAATAAAMKFMLGRELALMDGVELWFGCSGLIGGTGALCGLNIFSMASINRSTSE
jgi:hypothetical protein